MTQPLALFDMDNTLFDYEGQLRSDMRKLMSPDEIEPEDLFDEERLPYLKARMDLIKNIPGWWKDLPKFQLGWDVFGLCQEKEFKIHVLTKTPNSKPRAAMEKLQCLDIHCPGVRADLVGEDKSRTYGMVLVDDYPPYVEGWLEHRKRGLAIMPAHRYNAAFKHPNVIRYDGSNLREVAEALDAVKARKSGEHWKQHLTA
jgi:5'-nucleotidase